jgi:hypothetical protein
MSGGKMRLEGKVKLGFYPLPVTEAGRIRRFLRYPENSCAAIDPCIGDGIAFAVITGEAPVLRYGIGPLRLVYNGLPLDEIEDLLTNSPAYRQASRILFAQPKKIEGRPLTPLHAGHVALLTVSSMLDGLLGSGEDRHIAAWRCVKVTDRSEEIEEDGTIIQSERERFANELTLVYASGKTAVLS